MTQEEKKLEEKRGLVKYEYPDGFYCLCSPNHQELADKKHEEWLMLVEQNAILQELKALHLRMEHQTVCNDAGGNKMWSRAWRLVNEAINVIKEDKDIFKW